MYRFVFCFLLASASIIAQTIPTVHAPALDGSEVDLPNGQRRTVLICAFSEKAVQPALAWAKQLNQSIPPSAGIAVYQIGVLGGVPRLVRGFVLRSLKMATPVALASHYVPLFIDESAWRAAAKASDEEQPTIIVVTGDGSVLWQEERAVSPAGLSALEMILK